MPSYLVWALLYLESEENNMETKPGYLTTEFWTTITLNTLGTVQLIAGPVAINNKWVALGMAIVSGLYSGSRGLAKAGQPYKPAARRAAVSHNRRSTDEGN